jgi:phosphoribosyl 1,2-cyclic phosphate phosphodiesterase
MDDMRRYCDLRKGEALPVYTNEEGESRLRSIFGYAIGKLPKVPGYPAFLPQRMPASLDVSSGVIRSARQSHGSFDTLGVVLEEASSGKKLAYFTDCDSVSDEAVVLAKGSDIVILDALRKKTASLAYEYR